MKRLHFTRCRTSLLAVLLAFSVAFVPVPPISDTSSDSAALITTAQAAQKNTKDRYTSLSYGNWFASLLEQDLLSDTSDCDYVVLAN